MGRRLELIAALARTQVVTLAGSVVSDPSFRMQQLLKKILYLIIITSLVPPHFFQESRREGEEEQVSLVCEVLNEENFCVAESGLLQRGGVGPLL